MSEQPQADAGIEFQEWQNDRSPDGTKDRIIDDETARVMADASDSQETAAAGLRYAGNKALTDISGPDEYGKTVRHMVLTDNLPERFRGIRDVSSAQDIMGVDELTAEIGYQQEEADKNAEFAGRVHDSLKNTKR